jgi:CDP-glycerol glycerophosphotransferase
MSIIRKLCKKIKILAAYCLYYASYCVPKNKNLWIFGAWFGDRYADNSRYYFEYIVKNHPNINAVWFTFNKDIHQLLLRKGYKCICGIRVSSILLCLRAKIAIVCQSREEDLPNFINPNVTKVIQLWHGIPLKKICDDVANVRTEVPVIEKEKYFFVTATSEETKKIFLKAFRNMTTKVVVTGYPRNDVLLSKNKIMSNRKKVLYMPTFRKVGESVDILEMAGIDFQKTNLFLEDNNLSLSFKLHPVSKPANIFLDQISRSKSIEYLSNEEDVYTILNQFDILITDYSSIYFDFLLLNRPIIFYPFDLDDYSMSRGIYYEYDTCTPGYKADNWDEVLMYIELSIKKDLYHGQRKDALNRFHTYIDNHSSDRIYDEIIKSI